ncbi:MAG: 3-deoxy-8-phosphooctulonate synthase [Nitrospirae bacterium RBG_16_64_22]|nr:MAG: 3-deoxy-8-phosphooctulonate synthase [Nitrospirae bacterium RBG_16_64_22]
MPVAPVACGSVVVGGGGPLALIAGPCVIESEEHAWRMAGRLKETAEREGFPFIFKASYDKANRSSIRSFRGPGLAEGLRILGRIREGLGVPVLSDVHRFEEIGPAAAVLDVIQVPAFLCRQTDFLLEAARTGRTVNVKKGQFMAPWDIGNVVEKIASTGNGKILLTERGASFGYNNLVADMRSLVVLRRTGYPVVFDATHSVQLPGGAGDRSAGDREFAAPLARAAAAVGIDALFLEVHDDPDQALSDGPNMVRLDRLPFLLREVRAVDKALREVSCP